MLRALPRLPLRTPTPLRTFAGHARAFASRTPPSDIGEGEKVIYDKLNARFPGTKLDVQDVSGGCGSFYAITISSPEFSGKTMVKQHKLVNDCLKEDIKGIHGLQLKTIAEDAEA